MRRTARAIGLGLGLLVIGVVSVLWLLYPKDTTPKGAYLRVMSAVNSGRPEALFPYLETRAQHSAFTIFDYSKQAYTLVQTGYPKREQDKLLESLRPLVEAGDGPGVFALMARQEGWIQRLRRDLSGVRSVEIDGERATVETTRGTRYPFRRRENGIWGLTLFTSTLVAQAEKAARDHVVIQQAAKEFAAAAVDPAP